MYRFKQLFGNNLRSRGLSRQRAEVRAKCEALNIMTRLGMPKGEWVPAEFGDLFPPHCARCARWLNYATGSLQSANLG